MPVTTTRHVQVRPALDWHLLVMAVRVQPLAMDLTHAWAFLVDEVPLCCFGVSRMWEGVGHAWFLERDPILHLPYARTIARQVHTCWQRVAPQFRYVEALVMADRADSRRLIEWLGFQQCCWKPDFGPGGELMIEYRWRVYPWVSK